MTDALHRPSGPEIEIEGYLRNVADRVAQVEQAAQRRADAIVVEAERQAAARLAEADRQAALIVDRARADGRTLVEAVRRSLDEAVRLRDEELMAAVSESHHRVLNLVGQRLAETKL